MVTFLSRLFDESARGGFVIGSEATVGSRIREAPWYWIVDPQLRTIEVSRLVRGRYVDALGVSEG